ncbi:hypothetical protein CCR94_01335 [Rhodoblastus sphagnicola]|uniref:Uncharacterized protein n=1 Tax=Rhodoblastus sphagnicola TaxID=333368 RepID=A0A2S6NFV4_9HYPH|nr:hypothetical protein CCR94_01335 [Rhodoblastus sphagnicola]
MLITTAVAESSPLMCNAIARKVSEKLRVLSTKAPQPGSPGLSIAAAFAGSPVKMDFGAPASAETLAEFPLADADRKQLSNSVVRIARAGGDKGLVLIDGVSGAGQCHSPHLFSLASGEKRALEAPAPNDPLDRCGSNALALTEVEGDAYFVETDHGAGETEHFRIIPQQLDALAMVCSITVRYQMEFAAAESFCEKPELCQLGAKAAVWARSWRMGSAELHDPAFSPAAAPKFENGDRATLPLFGGVSKIAPQAPGYDVEENFFNIAGEPDADLLRIGAAKPGPANLADPQAFTLVGLYKSNRPVASFVVVRRRSAFASVTVNAN